LRDVSSISFISLRSFTEEYSFLEFLAKCVVQEYKSEQGTGKLIFVGGGGGVFVCRNIII